MQKLLAFIFTSFQALDNNSDKLWFTPSISISFSPCSTNLKACACRRHPCHAAFLPSTVPHLTPVNRCGTRVSIDMDEDESNNAEKTAKVDSPADVETHYGSIRPAKSTSGCLLILLTGGGRWTPPISVKHVTSVYLRVIFPVHSRQGSGFSVYRADQSDWSIPYSLFSKWTIS